MKVMMTTMKAWGIGGVVIVLLGQLATAQQKVTTVGVVPPNGPVVPLVGSEQTDASQELKSLVQRATQGDAEAQYRLGRAFNKGDFGKQDLVQAAKWWLRAAEQGHVRAQLEVSLAYSAGTGVLQDSIESLKWLDIAASRAETVQEFNEMSLWRRLFAQRMSASELAEAKKRAKEWVAEFDKRKK